MFHAASVFFRDLGVYADDVAEEACEEFVSAADLGGSDGSRRGERDAAISFVLQIPPFFKGPDGRKHRRLGDAEAGSDIGHPYASVAFFGEESDHLQVIFERLRHIQSINL